MILCRRYWSPDLYPMRGARVAVPDTTVNDCLTIGGFSFNVEGFDETRQSHNYRRRGDDVIAVESVSNDALFKILASANIHLA